MRSVSHKGFKKSKQVLCQETFFSENRAVCEIILKYIVQSDRPQITE